MFKIIHQRNKCIGCFYCVELAPERWVMDETDGKSFLIDSIIKKQLHIITLNDFEYSINKEIEELCPVKCIQIIKI